MKLLPKIEPGMKFGKWTVLEYAGKDKKRMHLYLCRCECGAEKPVRADNLRSGLSKKCVKCKAWRKQVSVICLETGEQYRTIKEAASAHYISDSALKSAFQRSESQRIAEVGEYTLMRCETRNDNQSIHTTD